MTSRRFADEPVMSDKSIIVSVEDLIHTAFGSMKRFADDIVILAESLHNLQQMLDGLLEYSVCIGLRMNLDNQVMFNEHVTSGPIAVNGGAIEKNTVNFKLVQTILHILARQLRLLEQDVEIKFDEMAELHEADNRPKYTSSSSESEEDDRVAVREREREKKRVKKEQAEKEGKTEPGEKGEQPGKGERGEKGEKKEKQGKGEKEDTDERVKRGEKRERQEKRGKGEKEDAEGKSERVEQGEKKEKQGKGEKEDAEGKGERGEKREKKEKRGKGEKEDAEEKGERGEKGEKKEKRGKGEKEHAEGKGERSEKGEKKEKRGKGGKEDAEGKSERGETGEKKEKRGKGVKEYEEEKGERGEKGEKKEKQRKGEKSSKDREGKEGSKDRDEKDREDKKSTRGRKGDDDGDEHEKRRGGRSRERGGERGGRHDSRKGSPDRSAAKQDSGTSITVTEASRRDGRGKGRTDKILVAERGPASRTRQARVGSIEVVTASQFALLERAVKQLEQVSGPPPVPALPDNEQLRKDLAKGRASLSDTMQAVQLNARVQAAEQGLTRMAELLTQLAMAGALPLDMASRIGQMQAELNQAASAFAGAGGTAPLAGTDHGGTGIGPGGTGKRPGGTGIGHGGTGIGPGGTGIGPSGTDTGLGSAGAGKGQRGAGTGKGHKGGRGMKSTVDPSTMYQMQPSVESVGAIGVAGAAGAAEDVQPPAPLAPAPGVTHQEMNDVLQFMKDAVIKEIQNLTARANHSADMASNTSRSVALKLATTLQIDGRITDLFSQTEDYAEQLQGFDSGLTTQMTSFQEQMNLMRKDLTGGLTVLASANNNAATAAIVELGERYEGLLIELDNTVHVHQHLSSLQHQLSDELKSLVECVEMLREQKADRDEVLDGLRDKADLSRLVGLLYEKDFAQARYEIENRLVKCYDKFNKQDQVWQTALDDLTLASEKKAEHIVLMAIKETVTQELNDIQEKLRKLEMLLGEPQAALLMRKLAKDAACGACLARAVMPPMDASYGMPCKMPPLRPPPLGAEDQCLGEVKLSLPDSRDHTCHRWVGGSHTLMGHHVAREKAGDADLQAMPTKKFDGYGTDGRLYMMEEELQPCAECSMLSTADPEHALHSPMPTGAGDGGDQAKG